MSMHGLQLLSYENSVRNKMNHVLRIYKEAESLGHGKLSRLAWAAWQALGRADDALRAARLEAESVGE